MKVDGRRPAELQSHEKSGVGAVAAEVLMVAGAQCGRQRVGLHAFPDL